MKCPYCYTELPDTAKFCYKCKSSFESSFQNEKKPCPNCGAPLPKMAKECYVCHKKFDNEYNYTPIVPASAAGKQSGFQPGYKPYTRLPQNNQNIKMNTTSPKKKEAGCGTAIILALVLLAIFYFYPHKDEDNDGEVDRNTQKSEVNQSIGDDTGTTVESNTSPLEKKVAADMKNMKVGDVGKKGKVYLGLAYVKRSNEIHYLTATDYTDSEHEILYFFVDIYNNSNENKSISSYDFSCYIDGNQVGHFDCNFLFTEDGISEYNSNEIDTGCSRLLGLDYEVPNNWKEAKLYYGSDCIWVVNNDEVSEEAYAGQKVINAEYNYQNTQLGSSVYSGDYELIFDGFEYYIPEGYYKDDIYAVFKFTINAKSEIDSALWGHNMRCYHNNYLTDDATFLMDEKINDYINVFSVDEIHEGMAAKVYIAFEVTSKGGDFRLVFDDGYISDNIIANVYVVGTSGDDEN